MHSFVTSKNVKWCHLIWPTLYTAVHERHRNPSVLYTTFECHLTDDWLHACFSSVCYNPVCNFTSFDMISRDSLAYWQHYWLQFSTVLILFLTIFTICDNQEWLNM